MKVLSLICGTMFGYIFIREIFWKWELCMLPASLNINCCVCCCHNCTLLLLGGSMEKRSDETTKKFRKGGEEEVNFFLNN